MPGDPREGYPKLTMSNKTLLPCRKVPSITLGKAKKAPMCSMNFMAIELKGLAAPGEP